jgi:hypothetical protein
MLQEVRSHGESSSTQGTTVRHLRQALLWPLRLIPAGVTDDDVRRRAPWQLLREMGDTSPWREHVDEYNGGAGGFHERHYNEFVSFLPYVQRFLYGQGRTERGSGDATTGSPMRVFRRRDIAAVRVVPRPGDDPVTLQVVHVDLYFFYGVDIVLLNVEVSADDLSLSLAHELMYRFGRAYPAGWDAEGQAVHCLAGVEWLDAEGDVLARSDVQQRDAFLSHLAEHRAPRISEHWEYVLAPLVNHHSGREGPLRFRQIEYYRMPMMAYLAVDDPRRLTRSDFVRLGLVTGGADSVPGSEVPLPYAEAHVADFEQAVLLRPVLGRIRRRAEHALPVLGPCADRRGRCAKRVLPLRQPGRAGAVPASAFPPVPDRHFQKATLLMVSDQLAEALNALDISQPESIKRFKRHIRLSYVAFLGFTHRYWFHEVSEQAHVKALFHLCTRHLQIDTLYVEVKERIRDMNAYLDADALRRQANTVVRLTVVTVFGLIGTITTGFLGMNLIAAADEPLTTRTVFFLVVLLLTVALTVYTMVKSKRLSDFLDAVSDERLSAWTKVRSFLAVWKKPG